MEPLAGSASRDGTRGFQLRAVSHRKLPPAHFRPAPGGLELSSLGVGTYLGPADRRTDVAVEQAVRIAVGSGRVNVLDTAINYRHQRAERSVGRALRHLVEESQVAREELFVATKAGYLAPDGEAGRSPQQWVQEELVDRGVLAVEDIVDGSNAMSPRYLRDQVERSRQNLGVATLDLLYLHNVADAQIPAVGPVEFERRLGAAFEVLEELRRADALRSYGLATWECLRDSPASPGHFDLERAVEIARDVGGPDHGFRFVQFPFNVAMPEAARALTQRVGDARCTLFEAVQRLGLGAFTSVPLLQGQLAQHGPTRAGLSRAQTAIQFARSASGTIGPLVGQKRAEHLSEDLEVASLPPWDHATFASMLE